MGKIRRKMRRGWAGAELSENAGGIDGENRLVALRDREYIRFSDSQKKWNKTA
jgi:hypothetical protein